MNTEVHTATAAFNIVEFIQAKRDRKVHPEVQIREFIRQVSSAQIPDYQISAWLMAAYLSGLNDDEVAVLTDSMKNSGWTLNKSLFKKPLADKHSTGGVGDKTTMLIGPIVAAAGFIMPSLAGRGLGHTGGTVDKLESIPGFRSRLTGDEFVAQLERVGLVISGQSKDICPADRKLYELRDVTGTVDSIPLICASILSKKLAEGLDALVLDVKFGNGALMKSIDRATALADALKRAGQKNNVKTSVLITNMNQPLGRYVGNAVEIKECIEILEGKMQPFYEETLNLTLELCGVLFELLGKCKTAEEGKKLAKELVDTREALTKWNEFCQAQGRTSTELPQPKYSLVLTSERAARVLSINTEKVGWLGIDLGAGRHQSSEALDLAAGFEWHVKIGHKIKPGDPLVTIFGNDEAKVKDVHARMLSCLQFCEVDHPVAVESLIYRRI